MSIQLWWPALPPATKQWLMDNNGAAVPGDIVTMIAEAGGPDPGDSWWVTEEGTAGPRLPDQAIDWIEATANGETPQ
ncbi:hypothetical protein [Paenarthrobacter nitroguajacolicus]|uniref:hypothetical protein n=1 Tax=Paenarthrobacter nitroguajacolicus TaxID=211146 RepID=UPI004053A157